jgi:type VI secretion system secreted protein Hcp
MCDIRPAYPEVPAPVQTWRSAMPFYASINIKGASAGARGGAIHAMSHGNTAITPRNLAVSLSSLKAQYDLGSGQLTGRRQHSPLVIIKKTDSSSPSLFQHANANSVLQSVIITIVRASNLGSGTIVGRPSSGGGETVVARITLTNATISKIQRYVPSLGGHHSSPHDTNQMEEIELVFQKIEITNVGGSSSASDDWKTG